MKSIGILIASISSLCLLFALNMSTTVTTEATNFGVFRVPSVTAHNLGLMQDKQNYITVSAVFLIIGLALYLFFSKNDTQVPKENNALLKKMELSRNLITENLLKFNSDERNFDNDSYKLYLVEKYKIRKNEVLNQFVLNNKPYETIGEVLNIAHNIELQESIDIEKEKEEKWLSENASIDKGASSALGFFILSCLFSFVTFLLPLPKFIADIRPILIFALIFLGAVAVIFFFIEKRKFHAARSESEYAAELKKSELEKAEKLKKANQKGLMPIVIIGFIFFVAYLFMDYYFTSITAAFRGEMQYRCKLATNGPCK